MELSALIPLLVLASSILPSLLIFFLGEDRARLRIWLYLGAEIVKLLLVVFMLEGIYLGQSYETRIPLLPGVDFLLRANALAMLFLMLSAGLWLVTTIYAIGYMEELPYHGRFYGFFGLSVTSTAGLALAGNLFTFYFFYETLTLATYPLVVHRQTREALAAGRTYMRYAVAGGALLLLGVVWLQSLVGPVEFTEGGSLVGRNLNTSALVAIFALMIAGLGVKTALFPLHGWLPMAMIAPAPVSALVHAVAVVKAGAFGIVRVVYEVFGLGLCRQLGVLFPLSLVASTTIIYGSLRALVQDDLKRRLAYSTVSQLSYIVLGVAIVGTASTIGGIVHLMHQGIMKITLFFCAGILAHTLGITRISEMDGVGRRMPATMVAFSIAVFGMIGLPPFAGFISKWYLGMGAVEAGQIWSVAVLITSTLLNMAYFLPIVYAAWFKVPAAPFTEKLPPGRFETGPLLLAPALTTALLTLLFGLFAASDFSPLQWSALIAERELTTQPEVLGP